MITIDEVLEDVKNTAHLWCELPVEESDGVTDPALIQWRMDAVVQKIRKNFERQARLRTQLKKPRSFVEGHLNHWRRLRQRWNRTMRKHAQYSSISDPSMMYFKNQWKKCERLFTQDPQRAVDRWLDIESTYWDHLYIMVSKNNEQSLTTTFKVGEFEHLAEEETSGIYNLSFNAQRFRQWFLEAFPECAQEWDLHWGTYFHYLGAATREEIVEHTEDSETPSNPQA